MKNNIKKNITLVSIFILILLTITSIFIISNNVRKNNFINSRLKLTKTLLENNEYDEAKNLLEEILLKYPDHLYGNLIYKNLIKGNYELSLKLIDEYLNNKEKFNKNDNFENKELVEKKDQNTNQTSSENSKKTNQNTNYNQKTNVGSSNTGISSKNSKSSQNVTAIKSTSSNNSETKETNTDNVISSTKDKVDPLKQKYDELIAKGKEELKKGNTSKAIEYFEEAKKIKNDDYEVYEQEALAYYMMDPNSFENQKKIIENSNKALEFKKDSVISYILLGKIYYKSGLYEKSIESFDKALTYDPNNIEALEGQALNYFALKNDDKAKYFIEKLYKIDSKNFVANKYLGKWSLDEKKYNEALNYIETAYKKNPDDKENIINYLKTLYSLNKFNDVISVGLNSIKKDPKYVDEYLFIALSYWKTNQGQKAIDYFELGLKSNNYYDETYKYKYYYNYGKVLVDLKKYDEAEKNFKKAIEINSSYLLPFEELGSLYVNNMKKYKEAIEVLEKAIQLGGINYTNYFNLATAYKESGDFQKSLENYAQAINENKKIADVNQRSQNYAKVYTIIGNMIFKDDPNKAYEYYKKALTYGSPFIETYSGFCDAALKIENFNDTNTLNDTVNKFENYVKTSISTEIDLNREKAKFYVKAGSIYFKLKIYDKAELLAKKAISIISKYSTAYDLVIEALIMQKKYDEALKYIDTYLGFASEDKKKELLKKIEEINKQK